MLSFVSIYASERGLCRHSMIGVILKGGLLYANASGRIYPVAI